MKLRRSALELISIVIFAAAVFLYSFGLNVLNPLSMDYVLSGEHAVDPSMNFFGWHFYRSTPWTFPMGEVEGYFHPLGTNVGYADSVPLMAIFFKVISPLLPDFFQYLGVWLLLCYVLQGLTAYLLLKEMQIRNFLALILGSAIFILSTALLYRNAHAALNAHWLLIGSLWCYWMNPSHRPLSYIFLWQGLWLFLSAWIHPYLSVLIWCFSFALIIKHLWVDKSIKALASFILLFGSIAILLINWYIIGYLTLSGGAAESNYNIYSANINAFWNGMEFSALGLNFPINPGQFEGFTYLGAGVLILLLWGLVQNMLSNRKELAKVIFYIWPLILISLGLSLFAFSEKIYLNDQLLIEVSYPEFWIYLGKVFRASGRFIWLGYYLLLGLACWGLIHVQKKKNLSIILIIAVFLIQLFDIYPLIERLRDLQPHKPQWDIQAEKWDPLFSEVKEVSFFPTLREKFYDSRMEFIPFVYLAGRYHIPVNIGSLARYDFQQAGVYQNNLRDSLHNLQLQANRLYIIPEYEIDLNRKLLAQPEILSAYLDKYYIHLTANSDAEVLATYHNSKAQKDNFGINSLQSLKDFFDLHKENLVLVSAMDEATNGLDDASYDALRNMGANLDKLKFRYSYLLIVNQNKVIYEESSENERRELTISQGSQQLGLDWLRDIYLMSSGSNSGSASSIKVAAQEFSPQKRGFNMLVLNQAFEIIETAHFDTFVSSYRDLAATGN